jgi:hypothetical protein
MEGKTKPPKETQAVQFTGQSACPLCHEGRLAQSPSGQNPVYQKRGRIVAKGNNV